MEGPKSSNFDTLNTELEQF